MVVVRNGGKVKRCRCPQPGTSLHRTALVARDSGVSAKIFFLCLQFQGSSMAAPLDSEDDVSSFMSIFESFNASQCCGIPTDAGTRHRSLRTCGSGSILRLRKKRPGQQMRGNTRSMRRHSRGCQSWYAVALLEIAFLEI